MLIKNTSGVFQKQKNLIIFSVITDSEGEEECSYRRPTDGSNTAKPITVPSRILEAAAAALHKKQSKKFSCKSNNDFNPENLPPPTKPSFNGAKNGYLKAKLNPFDEPKKGYLKSEPNETTKNGLSTELNSTTKNGYSAKLNEATKNKLSAELSPSYNKLYDYSADLQNTACLKNKQSFFHHSVNRSADSDYTSAISHNSSFSSNLFDDEEATSSNLYYSACEILSVKDYEEILSTSINNWSLNRDSIESGSFYSSNSSINNKFNNKSIIEEDENTELIDNALTSTITELSSDDDHDYLRDKVVYFYF